MTTNMAPTAATETKSVTTSPATKPAPNIFRKLNKLSPLSAMHQKMDDLIAKTSLSRMSLSGGPAPKGLKIGMAGKALHMGLNPIKHVLDHGFSGPAKSAPAFGGPKTAKPGLQTPGLTSPKAPTMH